MNIPFVKWSLRCKELSRPNEPGLVGNLLPRLTQTNRQTLSSFYFTKFAPHGNQPTEIFLNFIPFPPEVRRNHTTNVKVGIMGNIGLSCAILR